MPVITNQDMRKALSTVIELAQMSVLPESSEPSFIAERNKQLKAIEMVENLKTIMFIHHLTRAKDDTTSGSVINRKKDETSA